MLRASEDPRIFAPSCNLPFMTEWGSLWNWVVQKDGLLKWLFSWIVPEEPFDFNLICTAIVDRKWRLLNYLWNMVNDQSFTQIENESEAAKEINDSISSSFCNKYVLIERQKSHTNLITLSFSSLITRLVFTQMNGMHLNQLHIDFFYMRAQPRF